jgi:hypothetical protein
MRLEGREREREREKREREGCDVMLLLLYVEAMSARSWNDRHSTGSVETPTPPSAA